MAIKASELRAILEQEAAQTEANFKAAFTALSQSVEQIQTLIW